MLVQPNTAPQHQATQDLIERLRERTLPDSGPDVVVGGATASFVDQSKATAERLPLFIGAVVVLSFLLAWRRRSWWTRWSSAWSSCRP